MDFEALKFRENSAKNVFVENNIESPRVRNLSIDEFYVA